MKNIIINAVFGFILGVIIGKIVCSYVTYIGPSSDRIKNNIYINKKTDECYKLTPQIYICPISYSMDNNKIKLRSKD